MGGGGAVKIPSLILLGKANIFSIANLSFITFIPRKLTCRFNYLSKGKLLEEVDRFVGLAEDKVLGNGQLGPAVLGRDEGLLGAEVVRIRVQSLKE